MRKELEMNKDNAIGFGFGLLAGAAIGGVVALLFAPESGKETRHLIGDKTTEVVKTVEEKTSGVMDTVRQVASEASRKGQAAAYAINH